jgi:hypothetical protein
VHARVLREIDAFRDRNGQGPHGIDDVLVREGEHRTVVVGVDVNVQQGVAARLRQRVDHCVVATLRHIRNALEHVCRVRCAAMRLGLALPQYDYSVAGESALQWDTVLSWARAAESAGFDSVWVSDHLFLDVSKYGGPADRHAVLDPIVMLAALAGEVTRVRLGTLVLCEALRPAAVLAKSLASLDVACGGRLDVGIGAGWYEPEYEAIGMTMPGAGERLDRLRDAVTVLRELLGGGPSTVDGR